MVEIVESAGDANTVLIRELLVKVVKVKKHDLAAIDDLVFLQFLNENSTELFLESERGRRGSECQLQLHTMALLALSPLVQFSLRIALVPVTFPESAPPNNVS